MATQADDVPEDFWSQIEHQLTRIKRLNAFASIRNVLLDPRYARVQEEIHRYGVVTFSADAAFFAGSGGDNQLVDALSKSWSVRWKEFDYYYVATNAITGDRFEYIEGDLRRITLPGRP